jgi:anthranilate synthase component 1
LSYKSTFLLAEKKKFLDGAKEGNLVPLYKRVFSDQLTPVLAYRCLVQEDERDSPSFLFESIEQGKLSDHEGCEVTCTSLLEIETLNICKT